MSSNPFAYDGPTISALEICLSADRMSSYLVASGGDRRQALALYTYNTALSAGLYGPLQVLEVALRNAFHARLSTGFGAAWHDDATFQAINPRDLPERIAEAKQNLVNLGKAIDTPHIVAQLSFGFWVSLAGKGPKGAYITGLWIPHLRAAFPHVAAIGRKDLHRRLERLRRLRNRIAHHEPIFSLDAIEYYESILELCSWIDPRIPGWIEHHSRVRAIVAAGVIVDQKY